MTWPLDPVIVLGNGPVGQTAALLLARWGVPSILLDQRAERDMAGSRAICQQRHALEIWESLGAPVAAEGVVWSTARTFYHGDELFAVTLAESDGSLPPFVNISQARTEQLLDEAITRQPLIDVRWGHRVDSLEQDSAGVAVAGPRFTLRAPYLLCCAGARADELRAALGVELAGMSFDDRFLICDIRASLPGWANERRFYFDPEWNPGRQILIHPCPDSTYRIDWQVPPDYDLADEMASGALDRRIRAILGATPYRLVWSSVYRFHTRCADRMRVGRVLLAGDCAHLYSPFGARGLNSGVADAENAAWKIAYAGRGWAPEDTLLESYHTERHAAARENVEITTATMDFLVPRSAEMAEHRREVLRRARTDPSARASVNSGRLAEPFWYADSPLTTQDPTRPFTGRPAVGTAPPVAPGVLVPEVPLTAAPDGHRTLRSLARAGFLLLVPDRADLTRVPAAQGVRACAMSEIDRSGALADALGARPGEVWLVRPDAYLAAVVPAGPRQLDEVAAALRRAYSDGRARQASQGGRNGVLPAAR